MVRGLVNKQPTRIFFFAVPPSKIICAVVRVEQPVKVHREHVADHAAHQQIFDLRARRRIAVIERDATTPACAALRCQHTTTLLRVRRHRLFRDHIASRLHRPDQVIMVRRIDRCDDHRVRLHLGQHPPKICGQISGRNRRAILRRTPPSQLDATGVDITEAHQLGGRRVDLFNPILIQFVARTEPHDCIAATLGRLRG